VGGRRARAALEQSRPLLRRRGGSHAADPRRERPPQTPAQARRALLAPAPREDLPALDEALTHLAAADRTAADLVQLRYFGGLPIPEAARALGISPRTAKRLWAYARAWFHQQINGAGAEDPS